MVLDDGSETADDLTSLAPMRQWSSCVAFPQRYGSNMADLVRLAMAIETGDRIGAAELTQAAIDEGLDPQRILHAMTTAMDEVGRRFAAGEGVYIPEMLISANAMKRAIALLAPILAMSDIRPEPPRSSAPSRATCMISARTSWR